jgi:hypothetical protein
MPSLAARLPLPFSLSPRLCCRQSQPPEGGNRGAIAGFGTFAKVITITFWCDCCRMAFGGLMPELIEVGAEAAYHGELSACGGGVSFHESAES